MITILFAGSPEPAAQTLELLFNAQQVVDPAFKIAGVLSNPPSAKGRHKTLEPTPVAAFAHTHNIPVFTPEHLDSAAREAISPLKADLLVSFAYGHIFGPKFLAMFPLGGINLHPSLLPKYRGCTPVPTAIINRDKETAVTVQTLSLKMDEGDILAQTIIELNGTETTESLLTFSAKTGASLIQNIIEECNKTGKLPQGTPQQGTPSYTGIIKKEDGLIDWNDSAENIEAKIRGYYPEPACWCLENDTPLKILEAAVFSQSDASTATASYNSEPAGKVLEYNKQSGILIKTGNGILAVKKLQRQGKNAMDYKNFMNGARNFPGTVLKGR